MLHNAKNFDLPYAISFCFVRGVQSFLTYGIWFVTFVNKKQ